MVVFAIQKVKPSYCYTSTQHRLIHPTLQVTVKKILTVTAATKRRVGVSEVWVHPFIFSNFHEKHLVNKLFSIILFSLCLSIILTWQKYLPGTTYLQPYWPSVARLCPFHTLLHIWPMFKDRSDLLPHTVYTVPFLLLLTPFLLWSCWKCMYYRGH